MSHSLYEFKNIFLLVQITTVAFFCFLVTSVYVLYRADQHEKQQSQIMLTSISKQLEFQLLRLDAGLQSHQSFPDLSLWKETQAVPGVCIRFKSDNKRYNYSIFQGSEWLEPQWPELFSRLYQFMFKPGLAMQKNIAYKNKSYGTLIIAPGIETQLHQAWESIRALLELSATTILAVCVLVYISISRALRPAQLIVSGLEEMQRGDLTVRLPDFQLREWQRTSVAVNALAINQQQLLSERKKLTFKLIAMQDEERRNLARELHDEFGQCLASINALTAVISQCAKQDCPRLVGDVENISQINQHMMDSLHTLLLQLRPADIDELGLELSLNNLIIECNNRANNKPYYQLIITGQCQQLLTPYPFTLFRIIQEFLTNIARNSRATCATVELDIQAQDIVLNINDNGAIGTLPSANTSGVGLLGIRERVDALNGKFTLHKNTSGGLSIQVLIPINLNNKRS